MYIRVRAITKAKEEGIEETGPDSFTIRVRQKPERNMANERIIELVALHFGIPAKKVRIINGRHHPTKLLSVDVEAT